MCRRLVAGASIPGTISQKNKQEAAALLRARSDRRIRQITLAAGTCGLPMQCSTRTALGRGTIRSLFAVTSSFLEFKKYE